MLCRDLCILIDLLSVQCFLLKFSSIILEIFPGFIFSSSLTPLILYRLMFLMVSFSAGGYVMIQGVGGTIQGVVGAVESKEDASWLEVTEEHVT